MVSGYRSGAKIAEAPPLVNSNIAEISKNKPPMCPRDVTRCFSAMPN